ncbi:peptidoglycan-binding protein [Streptomyces smyrnaeus]|uniref:L,D-transpeptidase family protein n=1 Tax=Streptomyces TaxID=1883 RepID=UPI000C18EC5B|nr:L,D-transpeptidase family protein [Streptomyces sp. RK75]MBQ0867544.1 murein L,D-transpeptidase [Streptomyces sp. RK75]MBQ1163141.1 murein L,D-transpeptidase [Streptomyces sp. A73]
MHRRGATALRGLAASAAVLLSAGTIAGCQVKDGASGPAVRISQAPQQAPQKPPKPSAPSARTNTPPKPVKPVRPTPKPEAAQPVAQAVRMAPGARGAHVRELQARLRQLGHFGRNPTGYYGPVTAASVTAFQKQRGMPRTGKVTDAVLSALRARTHQPTRTELYPPTSRPLAKPDPRCTTGRALCISKTSRTAAWMVDGKVRTAMDVRFGSAYTPTREGRFKVDFKSRRHHSTLYDTPMPYAMFFSRGQAVHYSADFAARGYAGASHGCVNVRDRKKIAKVFAEIRPGDKVIVYR